MSIWSSVDGWVTAINNSGFLFDSPNYTGKGDENAFVDVATALSWHERIRLAFDGPDLDAEVLLSASAARELARQLVAAADKVAGIYPIS